MNCPICNLKHECPDPLYLKGMEYQAELKRLGVMVYPSDDHGALSVCIPLDGSMGWVAGCVKARRSALEHYHRVNWTAARHRYGVSVCLRMLRGEGHRDAARKARALWREIISGSGKFGMLLRREEHGSAVVVCRTLKYMGRNRNLNLKAVA